jgi:alanyl-tRNA synthetase
LNKKHAKTEICSGLAENYVDLFFNDIPPNTKRTFMTKRLYYQDSKIRHFSATCLEIQEDEKGTNIRLDQTAFYPTSGGQPHDLGTINGIRIRDVWSGTQGQIWHLLERAPTTKEVSAEIDWPRRFDHMQQHTGQHILSAVFIDILNANTIGFHIGSESNTIDLDISQLSTDDILQVENTANQLIWENRPISIQTIQDQEIAETPFRKPPQVSGEIRVIWIKDFDVSACGGTHVSTTGEVGLLKITGFERYKGGIRVNFICGERALKKYQTLYANIQQISADFSIHPDDLSQTALRLREENTNLRRSLRRVSKELMRYEVENLWKTTPETKGIRKIVAYWEDRSLDVLRSAAASLRENPKTFILFAGLADDQIRLICTRSSDLQELHAGNILKSIVAQMGGKGGGSPEMAQGGTPNPEGLDVENFLNKTLVLIMEGN